MVLLALAALVVQSPESRCAAVASWRLPDTKIAAAQFVAAVDATAPGPVHVAHCKVTGTIGSEIGFAVWLPETWNGRFLMSGGGGFVGDVPGPGAGLDRGFAVTATDTGHRSSGTDARWALNNLERQINFGYLATHRTAETAKAIVRQYYGHDAERSYFDGCSDGGREALMEAQRYPEDFDAIIAGAPVYNQIHLNESQVSLQVEMLKNPARLVPAAKVTLFNNAVVAACDDKDGVKDGIVSDPRTCKFDPAVLQCKKEGDSAECFTAAQVESARKAYASVTTKSGELVYPGHSPGFEFGWRIPSTTAPMNPLFADMPRYLGRQDANFDLMSFDLDTDLALAMKNGSVIEASDPNLAKFKARGGKLLMYHGWADPGPAPENTINYYNAVTKSLGSTKQEDWIRLFLMPGMGHCSGGVGPDQADFLGAMEAWKEKGTAPNQIIATRNGGGRGGLTPMTRPLCPFPQLAKYSGTGSADDAKNFVCSAP